MIANLKTLAAAQPAAPAKPQAVTITVNPAAVGANLLEKATDQLDRISGQLTRSLGSLNQLPAAGVWVAHVLLNPHERGHAGRLIGRLLVLLAIAGGAGWLMQRATARLLAGLALRAPPDPRRGNLATTADDRQIQALPDHGRLWYLLRRLPFALLRLVVELVPVAVFLAVGYLLLETVLVRSHSARLVCLATIYALVPVRVVWCVMRMLASPDQPQLRLVNVSDADARSLVRWTGWISVVIVAGIALGSTAASLGLPAQAENAYQKLLSLVVHLMLVAAVLRARKPMARWLRAPAGSTGLIAALRDWIAAIWAYVAIAFIVALWFVWAIRLEEGPERLLQVGGTSLLVLIGARLAYIIGLGVLERATQVSPEFNQRLPGFDQRIQRYSELIRVMYLILLAAVSLLLLFHFWGWNVGAWFAADRWGSRAISGGVTILVALALAALVWEVTNYWLHGYLERLSTSGAIDRVTRLRTIQPILRSTLLVILVLVTGMTILSQIGVNIAPLLAGAGIAGLAIGFGSQKLVQDVITGLFLLLDNAVRVGDAVVAAGLTGTVEHLSLRCLQLRAGDGTLHFIPFSAVTTVSNANRGGQGVATLRFEFDASTDINLAGGLLTKIGQQMRADPRFAPMLLGDLVPQGIEEMNGNKIAISVQFPCIPSQAGAIIYEFRRLMALEMKDAGIKLAGTPSTVKLFTVQPIDEKTASQLEAPRLPPPPPGPSEEASHDPATA